MRRTMHVRAVCPYQIRFVSSQIGELLAKIDFDLMTGRNFIQSLDPLIYALLRQHGISGDLRHSRSLDFMREQLILMRTILCTPNLDLNLEYSGVLNFPDIDAFYTELTVGIRPTMLPSPPPRMYVPQYNNPAVSINGFFLPPPRYPLQQRSSYHNHHHAHPSDPGNEGRSHGHVHRR